MVSEVGRFFSLLSFGSLDSDCALQDFATALEMESTKTTFAESITVDDYVEEEFKTVTNDHVHSQAQVETDNRSFQQQVQVTRIQKAKICRKRIRFSIGNKQIPKNVRGGGEGGWSCSGGEKKSDRLATSVFSASISPRMSFPVHQI